MGRLRQESPKRAQTGRQKNQNANTRILAIIYLKLYFIFEIKQREELDEKLKKSNIRADTMEKLSRTLQTERNTLKEQLKQFAPATTAVTTEKSNADEEVPKSEEVVVEAANITEPTEPTQPTQEVEIVTQSSEETVPVVAIETPAPTTETIQTELTTPSPLPLPVEPVVSSPSKNTTHLDETAISN